MLCNYQILITDVKPLVSDTVTYFVVCVFLTYSDDDKKSANRPLRVVLLDDNDDAISSKFWTAENKGSRIETDKEGQASFHVHLSNSFPGCLRIHIAADDAVCPEIFACVPTTSRRLCPSQDLIPESTTTTTSSSSSSQKRKAPRASSSSLAQIDDDEYEEESLHAAVPSSEEHEDD